LASKAHNQKFAMRRSLTQRDTSSEAVKSVLFQRVAGATPLVDCSAAESQQLKSSCRQGAFLYVGQYRCRRPQITVGVDQRLRRVGGPRPSIL